MWAPAPACGQSAKQCSKRLTAPKLDVIVMWRLDRWGRSLLDLIGTPQELNELGVGFVSLSEALDLTTASGRALAGMLALGF